MTGFRRRASQAVYWRQIGFWKASSATWSAWSAWLLSYFRLSFFILKKWLKCSKQLFLTCDIIFSLFVQNRSFFNFAWFSDDSSFFIFGGAFQIPDFSSFHFCCAITNFSRFFRGRSWPLDIHFRKLFSSLRYVFISWKIFAAIRDEFFLRRWLERTLRWIYKLPRYLNIYLRQLYQITYIWHVF